MSNWREIVHSQDLETSRTKEALAQAAQTKKEVEGRLASEAITRFEGLGVFQDLEDMNSQVWEGRGVVMKKSSPEDKSLTLSLSAVYPLLVVHPLLEYFNERKFGRHHIVIREGTYSTHDMTFSEDTIAGKVGFYNILKSRIVEAEKDVHERVSALSVYFHVRKSDECSLGVGFSDLQLETPEIKAVERGGSVGMEINRGTGSPYLTAGEMPLKNNYIADTVYLDSRSSKRLVRLRFRPNLIEGDVVRKFLDETFVQASRSMIKNPISQRIADANREIERVKATIEKITTVNDPSI